MSDYNNDDLQGQGFGKIYARMFEGSMAGAGVVNQLLMAYCIAYAKPPDGILEINPIIVATKFGDTTENVEKAIEFLMSPDPKSRTQVEDGRRLIHLGAYAYKLVTWKKHRDGTDYEARRQYWKEKQAEYREKKETANPPSDPPAQPPKSTDEKPKQTRTPKAASDVKMDDEQRSAFEAFWKIYPRKDGKQSAQAAFVAGNCAAVIDKIAGALSWQARLPDWTKDNGQFIPHAKTYLNNKRWLDEKTLVAPQANQPSLPARILGPHGIDETDVEAMKDKYGNGFVKSYMKYHKLRFTLSRAPQLEDFSLEPDPADTFDGFYYEWQKWCGLYREQCRINNEKPANEPKEAA